MAVKMGFGREVCSGSSAAQLLRIMNAQVLVITPLALLDNSCFLSFLDTVSYLLSAYHSHIFQDLYLSLCFSGELLCMYKYHTSVTLATCENINKSYCFEPYCFFNLVSECRISFIYFDSFFVSSKCHKAPQVKISQTYQCLSLSRSLEFTPTHYKLNLTPPILCDGDSKHLQPSKETNV